MSRLIVIAALLALPLAGLAADKPKPPNVIVIMADDFGYECVGANGGTSYKTPALDKLAATGVRFEHCHAQPLCTPTRVQLMTGLYNVRNYTQFGQMDPRAVTFAHPLKKAGYATGIAGKWQLGRDRDLPRTFGFDESCLWQHTRRPPRYANPGLEVNGVEKDYTNGEYGPDVVNDFALDFITRHKDRPFFLYYPMMLTHGPYQPTPDSAKWDPKARGEQVNRDNKHFADMTAYMDKLVGKLVAHLDRQGLRERTLIVFTGDNGTAGVSSRMGERTVPGGKGKTTANGMRVPLIASWPGTIPGGKVCGDLVDSTDFFPTLCEATGVKPPDGLDGRSFLPQLRGEKGSPREWCYCWYSPRGQAPEEFAFNKRYKLERDGTLWEFGYDAKGKSLDRSALDAEATAAVKVLEAALAKYKDARPAALRGDSKPGKEERERERE